jgi:hypothetical protein
MTPDQISILQAYFRGEKLTGSSLAVLGVVLLLGGWWTHRYEQSEFGTWLQWGLVVVGGLVLVVGVGLALKTGPQVADLLARLESDPLVALREEVTRMAKVNANWLWLKVTWAVIAAVGFVLVLALRREWSEALGLTLLLLTTTLMFTDVFAERRAMVYTKALQAAAQLNP